MIDARREPRSPASPQPTGGGDTASSAARAATSMKLQLRGRSYDEQVAMLAPPAQGAPAAAAAAQGVSGGGGALPHQDRIQAAFGRHDVGQVQAYQGGAARDACATIGAEAYATGSSVAFAGGSPSLHTAAHEAAHVVQQRAGVQLAGGVGRAGDSYEQHADAVADGVVAGRSVEALLDASPGGAASKGASGGRAQAPVQRLAREGLVPLLGEGDARALIAKAATLVPQADSINELVIAYRTAAKLPRDEAQAAIWEKQIIQAYGTNALGDGSAVALQDAAAAFDDPAGGRLMIRTLVKQRFPRTWVALLLDAFDPAEPMRGQDGKELHPPKSQVTAYFKDKLGKKPSDTKLQSVLAPFRGADPYYRACATEVFQKAHAGFKRGGGTTKLGEAMLAGGRELVGRQADLDAVEKQFKGAFRGRDPAAAGLVWKQKIAAHGTFVDEINNVATAELGEDGFVEMLVRIGESGHIQAGAHDAALEKAFKTLLSAKKGGKRKAEAARLHGAFPLYADVVRKVLKDLGDNVEGALGEGKDMLGLQSTALDDTDQKAKQDFLADTFKTDMFNPSTNIGRFGASYDPVTGRLAIQMKLFFDYRSSDKGRWKNGQKSPFAQQFMAQAQKTWGRKFVLACQKKGWEDIFAVPVVDITEVDNKSDAHFTIAAHAQFETSEGSDKNVGASGKRLQADNGNHKSNVVSGKDEAVGGASEEWTASIKQYDVRDFFKDPSLHEYLHRSQAVTVLDNAFMADQAALKRAVASIDVVKYDKDNAASIQANEAQRAVTALAKPQIPSSLTHLHPIELHGATTQTAGWASAREADLAQKMSGLGAKNPLHQADAKKTDVDGVRIQVAEPDPSVKATYIHSWSRVSAAHEFGHMIGLMDEYVPIESKELYKQLVAEGTHPAQTDTSHLTKNATSGKAKEQAVYAKLCKDSGAQTPAFMTAEQKSQDVKNDYQNASIMTGGWKVLEGHYATIWECLGELTKGHLNPTDWKVS